MHTVIGFGYKEVTYYDIHSSGYYSVVDKVEKYFHVSSMNGSTTYVPINSNSISQVYGFTIYPQ